MVLVLERKVEAVVELTAQVSAVKFNMRRIHKGKGVRARPGNQKGRSAGRSCLPHDRHILMASVRPPRREVGSDIKGARARGQRGDDGAQQFAASSQLCHGLCDRGVQTEESYREYADAIFLASRHTQP